MDYNSCFLISGGVDGTLQLWKKPDKGAPFNPWLGNLQQVYLCANGKAVFIAFLDSKDIIVWGLPAWNGLWWSKLLTRIGHTAWSSEIAINGTDNGEIQLCEVMSGNHASAQLVQMVASIAIAVLSNLA
ncbi:hypothetical protein F5J12DRAFT_786316 [Pisolithus orientalis]|uniref:uncharacterized protein n=1 Tax=Pisolithus orientalis TaxID=936130 RepID=UPI002224E892|nr:uncharacterized protein F5J12DRAFT_786316 [Pisolithus orientalis]KAI5991670.1 hypothetical protein F5J12DRAFT_786316 [Pisolithus orientalis]